MLSAGYLKQLGSACPKLIRIYSETAEQEDFPLSVDPAKPRELRAGSAVAPHMRDIALHHVIREQDAVREENRSVGRRH